MENKLEQIAEQLGYTINKEVAPMVAKGLTRNFEKHGAFYCPCKLPREAENICPCEEFRCTGHCHCGVFITDGKK